MYYTNIRHYEDLVAKPYRAPSSKRGESITIVFLELWALIRTHDISVMRVR